MPDSRSLTSEQHKLFQRIAEHIANQANWLWGSGIYQAGYNIRSYAHPTFYVELKESQVGNPNLDLSEVERIGEMAVNNVISRYIAELIEVQIARKTTTW